MGRWGFGFWFSATMLTSYLCLALFGQALRLRYFAVLIFLFCIAFWYLSNRLAPSLKLKLAVLFGSSLMTFLSVDIVYALYEHSRIPPEEISDGRVTAQDALTALPKWEKDGVVIFKPNIEFSAVIVGNLHTYAPPELLSPRHVDYKIDEHGFRNSTPLSEADVIAVGDSFTFGDGVGTPDIWTSQFEAQTGMKVSNIGFPGSGPSDEIRRFRYALEHCHSKPPIIVWLLYEGNDFEDQHLSLPNRSSSQGTILDAALTAIESVRTNSVLSLALSRRLYVFHHENLIYHSDTHGRRCFRPTNVRSAQMKHIPEMSSVATAFSEMRSLSESSQVLVVIAPLAAQVYGNGFQS